jgi:hypothetical protein
MAGFVKRESAQRWNRAAGIVEAAGAGSRFVKGLYRPPQGGGGGQQPCTELGDLQPGSYRGIAGATTAPGETGPVIVTGCDGEVTIDAVNHSGCTFYLGDLITVNVDPCCVAHFTGCSCCGEDCCDRSVAVCICGSRQILTLDGGVGTFDISGCIDCEGATIEITMACEAGVISAAWVMTCGEDTASGTLTGLDSLCDAEETAIDTYVNSSVGFVAVSFSNTLNDCTAPSGPPDCFCNQCLQNGILFTISGLSANDPFTCDCADFDGDYLLRYPEDVTSESCSQINLQRIIDLGTCGGEAFTLTLAAQLRCVGSPTTSLSWETSAALSSPVFQSLMPLATTSIPIGDVVCPLTRTFNNTTVAGGSQRCESNGVTVVAKTV